MKKSHSHDELSDITCNYPGCTKKIKERLIWLKQNVTLCYKHHCLKEANRGHTINTQPRFSRLETGLPVKTFNRSAA